MEKIESPEDIEAERNGGRCPPYQAFADNWVLWNKIESNQQTKWEIEAAYPSFELCYVYMTEKINEMESLLNTFKENKFIIQYTRKENAFYFVNSENQFFSK